jgi:hypothetical protein
VKRKAKEWEKEKRVCNKEGKEVKRKLGKGKNFLTVAEMSIRQRELADELSNRNVSKCASVPSELRAGAVARYWNRISICVETDSARTFVHLLQLYVRYQVRISDTTLVILTGCCILFFRFFS